MSASVFEDLLARVGSGAFPGAMFQRLRKQISLRQLIVCEYVRGAPVSILMIEGFLDGPDAGDITKKYLGNHFRRASVDSNASDLGPFAQVHFVEVHDISLDPQDVAPEPEAFTRVGGIGAIVARRGGPSADRHLVILVVRAAEDGRFCAEEKQFLLQNAEMIALLIDRHCEILQPPAGPVERWAEHLMACHGPLSQREAMVCAYALMGYSNEATALNLGVSVNSTITYRRRAFAKLRIKTQGELFPLLFFPKVATEAAPRLTPWSDGDRPADTGARQRPVQAPAARRTGMVDDGHLQPGSVSFTRRLFEVLRQQAGIHHLVIFEYVRGSPAVVLAQEGLHEDPVLAERRRKLAESAFVGHSAYEEPAPCKRQLRVHSVDVLTANEDAEGVRSWSPPRLLTSKSALVLRDPDKDPDKHVVIAFWRAHRCGSFTDHQKDFVLDHAAGIALAVERHYAALRSPTFPLITSWARYLEAIPGRPVLSAQEALVCAYGLLGYSKGDIAEHLEISVHSVTAYRRRAYAKLNITSQIELSSLLVFPPPADAAPPPPAAIRLDPPALEPIS